MGTDCVVLLQHFRNDSQIAMPLQHLCVSLLGIHETDVQFHARKPFRVLAQNMWQPVQSNVMTGNEFQLTLGLPVEIRKGLTCAVHARQNGFCDCHECSQILCVHAGPQVEGEIRL
jgi:hypothetical protein